MWSPPKGKSARKALAWGHTSNVIAGNSRTILTALSHPCGLAAKRFVVVEPWTLLGRSRTFQWLAGHRTRTPLPQSLHAHVYFMRKPRRRQPYTNRVKYDQRKLRKPNPKAGGYLLIPNHITRARFPRCHPVPLTSCPMAKLLRHPTAPLCCRPGSNIGKHPWVFEAQEARRHATVSRWIAVHSAYYLISSRIHLDYDRPSPCPVLRLVCCTT